MLIQASVEKRATPTDLVDIDPELYDDIRDLCDTLAVAVREALLALENDDPQGAAVVLHLAHRSGIDSRRAR